MMQFFEGDIAVVSKRMPNRDCEGCTFDCDNQLVVITGDYLNAEGERRYSVDFLVNNKCCEFDERELELEA